MSGEGLLRLKRSVGCCACGFTACCASHGWVLSNCLSVRIHLLVTLGSFSTEQQPNIKLQALNSLGFGGMISVSLSVLDRCLNAGYPTWISEKSSVKNLCKSNQIFAGALRFIRGGIPYSEVYVRCSQDSLLWQDWAFELANDLSFSIFVS